jgi:uncharacterized oligopeptide transporter (OPT) family protein
MIDVIGWAGSALLVCSLLQSGMMRLRVLNLIAALILVGYNAAVETWPMVGMNAAVAIIDIWYIVRLRTARADSTARGPAST